MLTIAEGAANCILSARHCRESAISPAFPGTVFLLPFFFLLLGTWKRFCCHIVSFPARPTTMVSPCMATARGTAAFFHSCCAPGFWTALERQLASHQGSRLVQLLLCSDLLVHKCVVRNPSP